jgi:radical SAM protein with 4Fe4S-binding SPASM domain
MILKSPLTVQVELNSDCNHMCIHCYNFWRNKNLEKITETRLSFELADLIQKELKKSGIFNVVLTGGEPLLNFDILLFMLKELSDAGITVFLNTNLDLMTKEKALLLKENGLKHILTSLLSYDEKTHDEIVNSKGAFKKFLDGVNQIKNAGIQFSVNMVALKNNISHIIETGLFSKKIGAVSFSATRVIPNENITDQLYKDIITNNKDIKSMIKSLLKLDRKGVVVNSLNPIPVCFLKSEKEKTIFNKSCGAGTFDCTISYDGSVRACPHTGIKNGSLLDKSLIDIWNKLFQEWRKEPNEYHKECEGCLEIDKCKGGCKIFFFNEKLKTDPLVIKSIKKRKDIKKEKADCQIDFNSKFMINTFCRFRSENGFGIVYTGRNMVPLRHQAYNLIEDLYIKKMIFSAQSLEESHKMIMNEENDLKFLKELLRSEVIKKV